jgi:hypothetical protein
LIKRAASSQERPSKTSNSGEAVDTMQGRVSSVTRNGKAWSYAQLVESYLRPAGMAALRLVENLGGNAPMAAG